MTHLAMALTPASQSELLAAVPADATCARHPTVKASATCHRCGTFVCAQDFAILDAHVFCTECAARPDVDYLEAYRLKYWGKRDGWAWLFGAGALINIPSSLALLVAAIGSGNLGALNLLTAALTLATGVNAVLFWLGKPIARPGVLVGLVLFGAINVATVGGTGAAGLVFPLIISVAILQSTRSKLFFKLPVSRAELKKSWDLFHNNTIARSATTLGVGGLLIAPFAPAAIVCGVIGLKRVDPAAHPPIGNKGRAIAGIVLGVLGTLGWVALGVGLLLARN